MGLDLTARGRRTRAAKTSEGVSAAVPKSLPPGFAATAGGRICIVTNEFHGLFRNGGIGTANTGLALMLAEAGYAVTVVFSNWPGMPGKEIHQLRQDYKKIGINLEFIIETPTFRKPFDDPRRASYAVYLYLKDRQFDIVYFHDNCGRGFYALLAKHTGCYPNAPLMLVVAHGPGEWVYELNSMRYYNKDPIIYAHLERRSVELADALISPSQYLVDWMIERGWKLPQAVFVEQNNVRVQNFADQVAPEAAASEVKEIVFFGRMEVRKGITLFCDAIDILKTQRDLSDVRIDLSGQVRTYRRTSFRRLHHRTQPAMVEPASYPHEIRSEPGRLRSEPAGNARRHSVARREFALRRGRMPADRNSVHRDE